jgi:hypothetical protein
MHDENNLVMTHAERSLWSIGAVAQLPQLPEFRLRLPPVASPSAEGEARELEIMDQ